MPNYATSSNLPPDQYKILMDYVAIVQAVTNYEELIAQSYAFFSKLGAAALNCALFERQSGKIVGLSSNMKTNWLDYYVRENYPDIDPFVSHFRSNDGLALLGWGGAADELVLDAEGAQVFEGARDAGYANMLFLPVKLGDQPFSTSITFANDFSDQLAEEHLNQFGGLITLASTFLGMRAAQIFSLSNVDASWREIERPILSPRECEVMKWLAVGLRTDQIAHKMGVQPVTIHMHVASARKKFGARTREQLMCMAIAQGSV